LKAFATRAKIDLENKKTRTKNIRIKGLKLIMVIFFVWSVFCFGKVNIKVKGWSSVFLEWHKKVVVIAQRLFLSYNLKR